ncbi:MAG: HigA family addiction module antitoxin [Nitrospirota bacterium]|nr:HigA family addiction module antitoxin [Nitrospirota bacterium]
METSKRPYKAVLPGEILRDELDARGWTQADFAEIIGRPLQAISEIVTGKKAVTPETAVLFSQALGTSPEFWLNLESAYRLDLLHQKRDKTETVTLKARLYGKAPVKELIRRRWIRSYKSFEQQQAEVCGFLGIATIDDEPKIAANFRKSVAGNIDTPSLLAWVRKAEIEAGKLQCGVFDPQGLRNFVNEMPGMSRDERRAATVPKRLCDLGVRLVFIPHLPHTRVDGAAFWLDANAPAVALSLRLDRIDNFWFTLMHELVHVMEGSKSAEGYLDSDIINEPDSEVERRTNQKARDLLISPALFKDFAKRTNPYFSRSAVLAFSEQVGVHPAIVVGRLQHEELIPYTNLRNLISKVSNIFVR